MTALPPDDILDGDDLPDTVDDDLGDIFTVSVVPPETRRFTLRFYVLDSDDEVVTAQTPHEDQTFGYLLEAGAGGLFAISGLSRTDRRGNQQIDLNGMLAFFDRVLVDGDADRLRDLLERKDVYVPIEVLGDVFQRIFARITGRPTPRPSSSPNGAARTGRTSTGRPLPKAKTSRR